MMKKYTLFTMIIIFIMSCNNDDDGNSEEMNFCTHNRTLNTEITDKEGELVYLEIQEKYAIRYYPITPTVDEVTYYILCEKPEALTVNDTVSFSGRAYNFNENEGFSPAIGGTNYYFLKLSNIQKDD